MFIDYEGYWYISRTSIMELLGKRLTIILQSFQQIKKGLKEYFKQSPSFDVKEFVVSYRAEMNLALQIDALCQSSLEMMDGVVTMYTIQDGEENLRKADVIAVKPDGGTVVITVVDQEDQEVNIFYCDGNELRTEDNGVKLTFSRSPTFLFDDNELDAMERLLDEESIQNEERE